jgi:hypothetical protein
MQAKQLEEEQKTLLAQLGSIGLQKKAINKRMPQIEEEQRKLVRAVIQRVGVDQFNAARIDGNNLYVEVPGELRTMPPPAPGGDAQSPAPNGHAADQN